MTELSDTRGHWAGASGRGQEPPSSELEPICRAGSASSVSNTSYLRGPSPGPPRGDLAQASGQGGPGRRRKEAALGLRTVVRAVPTPGCPQGYKVVTVPLYPGPAAGNKETEEPGAEGQARRSSPFSSLPGTPLRAPPRCLGQNRLPRPPLAATASGRWQLCPLPRGRSGKGLWERVEGRQLTGRRVEGGGPGPRACSNPCAVGRAFWEIKAGSTPTLGAEMGGTESQPALSVVGDPGHGGPVRSAPGLHSLCL